MVPQTLQRAGGRPGLLGIQAEPGHQCILVGPADRVRTTHSAVAAASLLVPGARHYLSFEPTRAACDGVHQQPADLVSAGGLLHLGGRQTHGIEPHADAPRLEPPELSGTDSPALGAIDARSPGTRRLRRRRGLPARAMRMARTGDLSPAPTPRALKSARPRARLEGHPPRSGLGRAA